MDQMGICPALNKRLTILHPSTIAPDAWRLSGFYRSVGFKAALFAIALHITTLHPMANAGMPVNPERPLSAETCEEALKRLKEAEAGSPLISREENRKILEKAKAKAAELCK